MKSAVCKRVSGEVQHIGQTSEGIEIHPNVFNNFQSPYFAALQRVCSGAQSIPGHVWPRKSGPFASEGIEIHPNVFNNFQSPYFAALQRVCSGAQSIPGHVWPRKSGPFAYPRIRLTTLLRFWSKPPLQVFPLALFGGFAGTMPDQERRRKADLILDKA